MTATLAISWLLAGCSGVGPEGGVATESGYAGKETPPSSPEVARTRSDGEGGTAPGGGVLPATSIPRKIIYTAEVDLVAEKLEPVERELRALVQRYRGYISANEVSGDTGSSRMGRWTTRIPADRYDTYMTEVTRLGEVQRVQASSQDVSEEYFDLEARIKNKLQEEQRLLEHLRKSTGKLKDILDVERELSRVREEVERMQGRLRYLSNQTDLATVTITLREVKEFVPQRSTTFADRIQRTFGQSLGFMGDVAQAGVLVLVALLPWLALAALVLLPGWWLIRRLGARRAGRAAGDT